VINCQQDASIGNSEAKQFLFMITAKAYSSRIAGGRPDLQFFAAMKSNVRVINNPFVKSPEKEGLAAPRASRF